MAHISNDYLQLNDDGTPRPKHDFEEQKTRHPVLLSVTALGVFHALALIKAAWFDGEPYDRSGRADGPEQAQTGPSHETILPAPSDAEELLASEPEEEHGQEKPDRAHGSGLKYTVSIRDLNFYDTGPIETGKLRSPLAPATNDNISLYGATPGSPITLPQEVQSGESPSGSGGVPGPGLGSGDQGTGTSPIASGSGGATGAGGSGGTGGGDAGTGGTGSGPNAGSGGGGPSGSAGSGGSPNDPRGNRLPTVSNVVILSTLLINEARAFENSDLLSGVSDADGDALQIENLKVSTGHVIATASGGWLYIPEFNDRSVVEFTFDINDGHGSITQNAYLPIAALPHVPLSGTDGDDDLKVDPADEMVAHIVEAGTGNDIIRTGSGDDIVYGGDGDDVIHTGSGNDVIYAGAGNDRVFAGSDDDVIYGETGDDELYGEDGNDFIEGGRGEDALFGGQGDDVLIGGADNDYADGGSGDDRLISETGDGDDHIVGGAGNDTYISAREDGTDQVDGGDGHDIFVAISIGEGDTFDGGAGRDTYDASSVDNAVIIDLQAGTVAVLETNAQIEASSEEGADSNATSGDEFYALATHKPTSAVSGDEEVLATSISDYSDTGTPLAPPSADYLLSIENVIGGSGDDIIIASDDVNYLAGGAGEDTFVFQTVASTGSGEGSRDKILDFEVGDRINIDDISAEFERDFNDVFDDPGILKFMLIAQGQEFAQPGEIRFKYNEAEGVTVLEGNIDTDSDTDFEIEILGFHQLLYDNCVYST